MGKGKQRAFGESPQEMLLKRRLGMAKVVCGLSVHLQVITSSPKNTQLILKNPKKKLQKTGLISG